MRRLLVAAVLLLMLASVLSYAAAMPISCAVCGVGALACVIAAKGAQ